MTNNDAKERMLMKRNMRKLDICREVAFESLDGILSKNEFFDFLDWKGHLPVNARSVIWCVLEKINSTRVTRQDPELVISRTGRIIQKSRSESEFVCGKRYLEGEVTQSVSADHHCEPLCTNYVTC